MTPVSKRKEQLEARLDELNNRLVQLDEELDSHNSPDWEELAVEREEDEVLESMGQSGMVEIRQIQAALQRIVAGEYGFCAKCGTQISEERLDVLPHTPFCRDCAV